MTMANATREQARVSPEVQQALLDQLESLKKIHAESLQSQAESNRRIAEGIAEIEERIRALTTAPDLAKAAAEDTGGQATQERAPALRSKGEGTRQLTPAEQAKLLSTLQTRLGQKPAHYTRPEGIIFADVERALEANPAAMWSLAQMERTGGEPDIVAVEDSAFIFADCSAESPEGRRNCVYDKAAEECARGTFTVILRLLGFARLSNGNAVDMAEEFGVEMWSPEFYRQMQTSRKFDCGTWSWLKTDPETRSTGDALDGLRVGGHVFVGRRDAHVRNGSGAWRGLLRVQKVS